MRSSKIWQVVSLLLVAVVLLSACAPAAAPEPAAAPVEGKTEAVVEKPVEEAGGAVMTIASYSEPTSLDPHISYSRHSTLVYMQLFDTLVVLDSEMNVQPGLAESWEVSDDGATYTFMLREDVKFHDGTPFNAEAVKYNFDRILDPATGSMMAVNNLGEVESTTVIDEFTFEIKFPVPNGPFLLFASESLWMISPAAAEELGVDNFGLNPVGTGPFKFVEWEIQDHLTMERNEDYNWASSARSYNGPAKLAGAIIRYVPENQTRAAALEAGEVDGIIRVPPFDVPRIREDDRFEVIPQMVSGLPTTFVLNTAKAPLDDVRVRRALNLWLDRDQVVNMVYAGEYAPAYGPLAPNTFGALDMAEKNGVDRDAAMALLKEAGWEDTDGDGILDKDGEKFHLDIYSCGDATEHPEAVDGQFQAMGADTKITMVPWSDQKTVVATGAPSMMVATFNSVDPNVLRLLFHSDNIGENGWNWGHMDEGAPELQAELDALLEKGDEVSDLTERAEIYAEIQNLLVDNGIVLPLRVDDYLYGLTTKVQNWTTAANGWPYFYELDLAE